MSAPVGPEVITTLTLHVGGGAIVADVLRFADGSAGVRLGNGGGVGHVLTGEQVGALRAMLGDVLGVMFSTQRRAA